MVEESVQRWNLRSRGISYSLKLKIRNVKRNFNTAASRVALNSNLTLQGSTKWGRGNKFSSTHKKEKKKKKEKQKRFERSMKSQQASNYLRTSLPSNCRSRVSRNNHSNLKASLASNNSKTSREVRQSRGRRRTGEEIGTRSEIARRSSIGSCSADIGLEWLSLSLSLSLPLMLVQLNSRRSTIFSASVSAAPWHRMTWPVM